MIRRLAAALALLAPTALVTPVGAGPDLAGARQTFDEEFDTLDLRQANDPDGRWSTHFEWGGRTLPTNGEMQVYVDRNYLGLGLEPFSVKGGVLTITARHASSELAARLGGHPYTSGLLTTAHSFSQTYGYFETRARLPAGKGLWPAFWLLPTDQSWPPEIDIFELLGDHPDRLHLALHSRAAPNWGFEAAVADLSKDFHVYGLMWGPHTIAWYLDGTELAHADTPADMHRPMYILLDLAVGGTWPGAPDGTTHFPAEMKIDYVRAWSVPASTGKTEAAESR